LLTSTESRANQATRSIRGTDTLVIVTADHGIVDSGPRYRIQLDDYPEIVDTMALPLCGDSRLAYCYVRSGREQQFEVAVEEALGDRVTLHRSSELVAEGYFGLSKAHPKFEQRIGDYVLIPTGCYTIRDWVMGEDPPQHIGAHGGTSDAEMLVPLIVAEG
jgi:hypothetical protein